jgi:hypothetical protein
MPFEVETVLFATDASADGVSDARAWAKAQGLSGDDVRIVKRTTEGIEQCLVIAKRQISSTIALWP